MNKRILICVLSGAAAASLFLSGTVVLASTSVGLAQKSSVFVEGVGTQSSFASSSANEAENLESADIIPTQLVFRDNMPGVVRPIWDGMTGQRQNQQAPRGTVRPRNDSNVVQNMIQEPVASVASDAVAQQVSEEQSPEVPAEQPAAEAPQDAANAVVPGTEAPTENTTLDLGNDNENAPDAAVKIPEGDVSDADRANVTQETNVPSTPVVQPSAVGKVWRYVDAKKAVADMTNDMVKVLEQKGGLPLYQRWQSYNASIRRRTNSLQTGNELNARCRLRWYERLYQDPLRSVGEVEEASSLLAQYFMGTSEAVVTGTRYAGLLTDVNVRNDRVEHKSASSPEDAIDALKAALVEAASRHSKALAPMSKNDLSAVMNETHRIFCEQVKSGHTVEMRGRAQYLIDAMEKINKSELYRAGESILSLLDDQTLDMLRRIDFANLEKVIIGDDQVVGKITCEAGDILVGDSNRTVWDLDKYPNACCIVDLGGSDLYREGSCILNRPLLVVIDLGKGSDEYTGKNVAIQGGAILGVSVWYDDGGNDRYTAKDVCQGSAIGGFGVLINEEGDDRYLGFLREQGTAISGFGLLIDRAGDDDYRGALFAQGVGGPGGFGAIVDRDGKDHYYVGGYYFDSYPEHPGYDGWGQGVGAGIRRVACGGVGALLDGGGDDAYEYDYFGHGGGYWMGIGFARDFGGNDVRYAATSTMYDGSARRERRWQRFGAGFGCHYAVGYLFDDQGDDVYGGTIMGVGMGWDLGAGFLVDFQGNDKFEANGGLTQGCGAEGSIGAILNYRGDDSYNSSYVGYSNNQLTYHSPSNCGSNFSFVVDHGGYDQYGASDNYRRSIQNNSITQRGNVTGMIIDRPAPGENTDVGVAKTGRSDGLITQSGYAVKPSQVKTMVAPPPLYDTTPHATSSGINAFNPTGGDATGPGLFGGPGIFGGRFF